MEESTIMYAEIDMKSKAVTKIPKCTSDNKEEQIEEIAKIAKSIWKKIIETTAILYLYKQLESLLRPEPMRLLTKKVQDLEVIYWVKWLD